MAAAISSLLKFINPVAGPIIRITSAPYPSFFKRDCWHSSAYLHDDICRTAGFEVFNEGSGGGWSSRKEESQVKAVVEALERWAFYYSSKQDIKRAGLDIDPTTNGFAALPVYCGIKAVKANAYCEALERWILDRIWYSADVGLETISPAQIKASALFANNSGVPGIYISEISNIDAPPLTGKKIYFCLALLETEYGGVLPGSSCGLEALAAAEHALFELYNHFLVFQKMKKLGTRQFNNIIEQRLQHFAGSKSAAYRVKRNLQVGNGFVPKIPETVFSGEIPGPWNPEVNVYRVLLADTAPFLANGVERFLI